MASKRNPRNPQSTLFKQLTRLLSGPLVNYRRQIPHRDKRRNLDKHKFKSASGQQFKKVAYDPFQSLTSNLLANQNRVERYSDFEQMEYEPIIASAMDIYADEMSTSSDLQPLLAIKCPNEEIKLILNTLYHKVLNVDFNLFGWCRSMCKFGDFFLYLDIDEELGIQNVIGMPPMELERVEGEDKTNPNYIQYQWNSGGLTFENWQVGHFRILGNDKYSPYGTSVLEPARRIWRQLVLLEDAMMAYRIVRSPERRVFYVDVGNISPEDVEQYMQRVMTQMKRNQVVDADTGRIDLRYNPLSIEEDYFVPVRGAISTKIESLPGGTYTGDIEDVKYLKDKLFAALKVPQAYLFRGEGAEEDKTTLAQKDVRFARTIQRLQRSVTAELEKIGIIHLYTLGYRDEDLVSFKLYLNNPSKIAELQELESWRTKFDAAGAATEGFFSKRWIADRLFGMSDEEFLRNQREMFYDRKFEAALEAEVEAGLGEAAGIGGGELGLGGDELGGDLGGDLGGELGGEDLGGELGGEGELGAEEEDVLLATPDSPGKRDIPAKWKGKDYTPVKDDKRRGLGPRRRSLSRKAGKRETSKRGVYPGFQELDRLSRGTFESQETNYSHEEDMLFEASNEAKSLIEELEQKQNEAKAQ
tara:strand:- start:1886 stop:3811 length:1926 start_codon:yes stop_codon:yes gene_type:complete